MKEQSEIIKWFREEELKAQRLLQELSPTSDTYFAGMIAAFKKTRERLKEND